VESKIINWGIIGAGKIAQIAADLNAVSNTKLYGIASRDLKKHMTSLPEFNADKAYGANEDLAMDTKHRYIYIATPHKPFINYTFIMFEA
jgi:predicted dehydrogenase